MTAAAPSDAALPEPQTRPAARGWFWRLLLIALAHTAVLGWMLAERVMILQSPTEITLTPEPVDPRDLFRGDYVVLRYGISAPPTEVAERLENISEGDPLWVTIQPALDGPTERDEATDWRIVDIATSAPDERPHAPELVLKGRAGTSGAWRIEYGVEWYFVPEGEGKRLETMIGDRALSVTLAVASDGRAAIKALTVEGETIFVEPLL